MTASFQYLRSLRHTARPLSSKSLNCQVPKQSEFVLTPPMVWFSDFEIGEMYYTIVEICNVSPYSRLVSIVDIRPKETGIHVCISD